MRNIEDELNELSVSNYPINYPINSTRLTAFFLFLRASIDNNVDEVICVRNAYLISITWLWRVFSEPFNARQHDKSSFSAWHARPFRLAYPSNRTIELKLTSGRSIYPCEGKRGGKKLAFIDSRRDSYILQRAHKPRVLQPMDQ